MSIHINANCIIYIKVRKVGETMKPLKEKISITVDSDLLEKVRIEAEKDDRSLSQYINLVLKKHIAGCENDKK